MGEISLALGEDLAVVEELAVSEVQEFHVCGEVVEEP